MSDLYNVILSGALVPGNERAQVVASFAARFKLASDKAELVINGRPTLIKKGVDAATAQKLVAMLRQIGLESHVQSQTEAAAAASVAPPPRPVAAAAPAMPAPPPASVRGFEFEIEGAPDFAFVTVKIPAGQVLRVEASAMATMDTNLSLKTKIGGGLSRLLTGESIFVNEFVAEGGPGRIGIAPAAPGDLRHLYLDNQTVYLQNSAFVACNPAVQVETKWQGLTKGFFSGESLFLIRCHGTGDLWFSSYGGIIEIDIASEYVVDTGNIVAFTDGLQYRITKVGGYKSLFFSGEGLVCRFSGSGKVWVQTRKPGAFARWANAFRPAGKRGWIPWP